MAKMCVLTVLFAWHRARSDIQLIRFDQTTAGYLPCSVRLFLHDVARMRVAPAAVGYIDPLNACFGRVLHGVGGVGKHQFMRRIDGSIMRFDHGNKNFRSDKLCLNIGCGKSKGGGII